MSKELCLRAVYSKGKLCWPSGLFLALFASVVTGLAGCGAGGSVGGETSANMPSIASAAMAEVDVKAVSPVRYAVQFAGGAAGVAEREMVALGAVRDQARGDVLIVNVTNQSAADLLALLEAQLSKYQKFILDSDGSDAAKETLEETTLNAFGGSVASESGAVLVTVVGEGAYDITPIIFAKGPKQSSSPQASPADSPSGVAPNSNIFTVLGVSK